MTSQPAYPGYATPTFIAWGGRWYVSATPWVNGTIGWVQEHPSGWTATRGHGLYVGLFPTQQAAGEALVKHAGYEVLR